MARVARTLWAGARLVCPNCQSGRIYNGLKKNAACPSCDAVFERPDEGDFLVTVVASYSITAVMIAAFVFILNYAVPGLDIYVQIWLGLFIGLGFSLLTYRNLKGLAVALLYLTFGLRRSASTSGATKLGSGKKD